MDIRSLKYFLAIADTLSITKASQLCHTTQPNLTRQLKALELEVGKPLFERGNKLRLTDAGILLRRRALEVVQLFDRTYQEVKAFSKEESLSGTLLIGGGESKAFSTIFQAYRRLLEKHPAVRIEIYSGDHIDVIEKMDKGLLDFAVLIEPIQIGNYESLRLPIVDTWGILMRKDAPLAKKEGIRPEDLIEQRLLLSRHILKSDMFFSWLGRKESEVDIIGRYNLIYNATLLVKEGIGYALTLDGLADTGENSELVFRPLVPKLLSHLDLVYRKYQPLSPLAQAFLEEISPLCGKEEEK